MPPGSYLYICDTKIDALYLQIPERKREDIAAALGLDLERLGDAAEDEKQAERTDWKLRVVLSYIEASEILGTVEEPGPYFRGRMSMQWGIVDNTALFVGRSQEKERHFVLLGGSARYSVVPDYPSGADASQAVSPFAGLLALFQRADSGDVLPERPYDAANTLGSRLLRRLPVLVAQLQAVQTVEFVAETLTVETGADSRSGSRDFLLIASPLYVALAE
ncbi:MAG: SAVMC3_10250 family protein [Anaerolineae bacterium]|nr:SAVMC3_10250 family protein [Anaerolineae bacterium]